MAKKRTQRAIDYYLETGSNERLKDKYVIAFLDKIWNELSEKENDYRTGVETYGYGDVRGTMEYISDRWFCAFRVKWLLDGLTSGDI